MSRLLSKNAAPLLKTVQGKPHATDADHEQPVKLRSSQRLASNVERTIAERDHKITNIAKKLAKKEGRNFNGRDVDLNDGKSLTESMESNDEDTEREPESDEDFKVDDRLTRKRSPQSRTKGIKNSSASKSKMPAKASGNRRRKSPSVDNVDEDDVKMQSWLKDEVLMPSKKANRTISKSKTTYSKGRREFKEPPKVPQMNLKDVKKRVFQVPPSVDHKVAVFQNPMEGIEYLFTDLPSKHESSKSSPNSLKEFKKPLEVLSPSFSPKLQSEPTASDFFPAGNNSQEGLTGTQSSHSQSPKLLSTTKVPKCPNCSAPVEKAKLDAFKAKHPFPLMSQEQAFCKKHKQAEGQVEWDKRGYPKVNWESLDQRMEQLLPDMINLLDNPESSYYRKQFQDGVERGEGRNLSRQFWGNQGMKEASVGYYGIKGLSIIMHFIASNLAQIIRKHAANDRLIIARDISGYVQNVLAPETACMLIVQDMKVDAQRAREIIDESTDLGCLMFPDSFVEPSIAQLKKMEREAKEKEKAEKKAAKASQESSQCSNTRKSPRGKVKANTEVVEIEDTPKKKRRI